MFAQSWKRLKDIGGRRYLPKMKRNDSERSDVRENTHNTFLFWTIFLFQKKKKKKKKSEKVLRQAANG